MTVLSSQTITDSNVFLHTKYLLIKIMHCTFKLDWTRW